MKKSLLDLGGSKRYFRHNPVKVLVNISLVFETRRGDLGHTSCEGKIIFIFIFAQKITIGTPLTIEIFDPIIIH